MSAEARRVVPAELGLVAVEPGGQLAAVDLGVLEVAAQAVGLVAGVGELFLELSVLELEPAEVLAERAAERPEGHPAATGAAAAGRRDQQGRGHGQRRQSRAAGSGDHGSAHRGRRGSGARRPAAEGSTGPRPGAALEALGGLGGVVGRGQIVVPEIGLSVIIARPARPDLEPPDREDDAPRRHRQQRPDDRSQQHRQPGRAPEAPEPEREGDVDRVVVDDDEPEQDARARRRRRSTAGRPRGCGSSTAAAACRVSSWPLGPPRSGDESVARATLPRSFAARPDSLTYSLAVGSIDQEAISRTTRRSGSGRRARTIR